MQVALLEHVLLQPQKEKHKEKTQRLQNPIREVLCQQTDAGAFIFWGRTKQSRWVEKLTLMWMNQNRLGVKLREELKRPSKIGKLFTLPWDLSTQKPRMCGGIHTGASLLQVLKTPVRCNPFD